jgi:hypothetical protein
MGRTESLNLKNDYERACGWYGHFNKSEMALFSECTDRYAQKLLDTADIVREAIYRQLVLSRRVALDCQATYLAGFPPGLSEKLKFFSATWSI